LEEVFIMGCLVAFFSRLALLVVWITAPLVSRAFHGGWILPLLGILFVPLTTLVYVVVYALGNGVTGWAWLWVVGALFLDVASHGSGVRANRHRIPRYKAPEEPRSE
jgi:hypothetical protein